MPIDHPSTAFRETRPSPWVMASLSLLTLCLGTSAALAQTGVSDDRVSLPEGPGSLEGIGENVDIDPNMGLMSYSVEIDALPGFAATTPDLSLGYSSGGSASPVGMGWSMPMPAIERMTYRRLPLYDESDDFCANGSDQLVRLPGTNTYDIVFDFNNDKQIDLMRSTQTHFDTSFFLNDGERFVTVEGEAIGAGFVEDNLQLADMNGDGLNDAVKLQLGSLSYRLDFGFLRGEASFAQQVAESLNRQGFEGIKVEGYHGFLDHRKGVSTSYSKGKKVLKAGEEGSLSTFEVSGGRVTKLDKHTSTMDLSGTSITRKKSKTAKLAKSKKIKKRKGTSK